MQQKPAVDWKAWLSWVGLTLLGVELAMLVVYGGLNLSLGHPGMGRALSFWLQAGTIGIAALAYSTVQSLWFRSRVPLAGWWIVSSIAAWWCTWILLRFGDSNSALNRITGLAANTAIVALLAAIGGLPQWLFVRRHFTAAGMWILARMAGWAIGLSLLFTAAHFRLVELGLLFDPSLVFGVSVPEVVAVGADVAIFGLGFAAITGAAMVWFQAHRKLGAARASCATSK